jgi:hypothetical protein
LVFWACKVPKLKTETIGCQELVVGGERGWAHGRGAGTPRPSYRRVVFSLNLSLCYAKHAPLNPLYSIFFFLLARCLPYHSITLKEKLPSSCFLFIFPCYSAMVLLYHFFTLRIATTNCTCLKLQSTHPPNMNHEGHHATMTTFIFTAIYSQTSKGWQGC